MQTDVIKYEHPLNERYRVFLRLECLFHLMTFHSKRESSEDSHNALTVLLDTLNVISRTDVKTETLKELDRICSVLTPLTNKPGVEAGRLDEILSTLKQFSAQLRGITGPIDHQLKNDELLKTLQQRSNIAGGLCDFDLPAYRYWLNQPAERRLQDFSQWLEPFEPLHYAIESILDLVRASTSPSRQVAENGIYKQSLDAKTPYQLLVVSLPANSNLYTEFSGSKHRFTVRFLDASENHPRTTDKNVEFEVSCCKL
ncbi:MAG: cell division protein ZapD [Gammaproteobacteria bacterium]|jgi:cell division protein ZapD